MPRFTQKPSKQKSQANFLARLSYDVRTTSVRKSDLRRRLLDLLVPGSFPDQFYRVGREVIRNKVDFKKDNTRKSK